MRTSIGLVDSFITGHETAELIVLSDDFPPEDDDVSVSVVQRVVQTEDAGVKRVLALHNIRQIASSTCSETYWSTPILHACRNSAARKEKGTLF